jgi:hypothetical protein
MPTVLFPGPRSILPSESALSELFSIFSVQTAILSQMKMQKEVIYTKNTTIVGIVGAAIIVGCVSFFIGVHYAERRSLVNNFGVAGPRGFGSFYGRNGMMMRPRGNGSVIGQITNVNGNTVTLQNQNGVTRTITLGSNSVINISTKGSAGDLKTGESVMILGNGFNIPQTVWVSPQ